MNDEEYQFLVMVAGHQQEARERLMQKPEYRRTVQDLGQVPRDVLSALLGDMNQGHVAKAWLSLVMQGNRESLQKQSVNG